MNKLLKLSAYGLCISLWFYTGCSRGDEPEPVDCDKSDLAINLVTKTPLIARPTMDQLKFPHPVVKHHTSLN